MFTYAPAHIAEQCSCGAMYICMLGMAAKLWQHADYYIGLHIFIDRGSKAIKFGITQAE